MQRTFNLAPTDQSPHNDAFWAVRAEPNFIVLAGSRSAVHVDPEGIKLGTKFFNIHGTLVRELDVIEYNEKQQKLFVKQVKSLGSYAELAKKKKPGKRRKGRA